MKRKIKEKAIFKKDVEVENKVIFKKDSEYPIVEKDQKWVISCSWSDENKEAYEFEKQHFDLPFIVVKRTNFVLPDRYYKFPNSNGIFYALIKAKNQDEAIEIYFEKVSNEIIKENLLDNVEELNFTELISEMKKLVDGIEERLSDTEILNDLVNENINILGIDRKLIKDY